jgi:hypothetical protein
MREIRTSGSTRGGHFGPLLLYRFSHGSEPRLRKERPPFREFGSIGNRGDSPLAYREEDIKKQREPDPRK